MAKEQGPRVVQKLSAAEPVWGVTSLNAELYVLRHKERDQVEIYDTTNYELQRHLSVSALTRDGMTDMTSCAQNQCLYIADHEISSVHRIQLDGTKSTRWSTFAKPYGLSVTAARTVLVTCSEDREVREFSTVGKQMRVIGLPLDNPWHAVQLSSEQLAVSHGGLRDSVQRVCKIAATGAGGRGRVVHSYGGFQGPSDETTANARLNVPFHMALGGGKKDRRIYVADCYKRRVLALNDNMELVRVVASRDHGLSLPFRLYVDQEAKRLYIADKTDVVVVVL